MNFNSYITLGRSGLRVSSLSLGTMTFGTEWGWGADENTSRAILNRYLDAGGNFIDTANVYTDGKSEEMLGRFLKDGLRDRVVLATKFSFNTRSGDPNAGGNGRRNIYQSLTDSLRRLQTEYVDLYWLHVWDTVTPVEEVVSTLDDLVRAGKIRHYGLSDIPSWYVARAQTLAELQGKERAIALQLEYSLVERTIEREHIPVAQELGLAVCPWSPLAGGFLTGKYKREGRSGSGQGRLGTESGSPFPRFTERNWRILDVLSEVANELGRTPAQVALNWVATQPGSTSTIIGATSPKQLEDNLAAIDFGIPPDLRTRLDEVSALEPANPYMFFGPTMQSRITGGVPVRAWTPARVVKASHAVSTDGKGRTAEAVEIDKAS
jgi:aryl-alcohol dehydrogenase-like predicted oxidoreductase